MANKLFDKLEMRSVSTVSLGCRLNSAEAQQMETLCESVGINNAIIVNTCAVTAEASRQSRQTIRQLNRKFPNKRIIVTGCASQVEKETFLEIDGVWQVIDNLQKTDARVWSKLKKQDSAESSEKNDSAKSNNVINSARRVRAFVPVQTGCDHRCTFCIIPYGRGPSRSIPAGEVVDEIKQLVDDGRLEIILTGVDLTAWGNDLPGKPEFGWLVQQILKHVPNLARLRISSLDCAELDPDLLDAFTDERVMPHAHLSLQSGANIILKRMKRRHLRDHGVNACMKLKQYRPDIAIGADLIAGFPTEKEQDFIDTKNLFEDCPLDFAHIFAFSPRQGTPASRMPQLPKPLINERASILRQTANEAFDRFIALHEGKTEWVMRERENFGHSNHYARVNIHSAPPINNNLNGDVIKVKMLGRSQVASNAVDAIAI